MLEKIIFYLLIFCLPFQTRKILHQWSPDFNEWTGAFLYFTDLLILVLFLFWFWRIRKERFFPKKIDIILILFLISVFISLGQAKNFQLGFYQWLKLSEFVLFFFYIKYNFGNIFHFERIAQVFIVSGLFQSIIAIGPYAKQTSLGLWWLRESPLAPDIIGAAKIVVDGTKMIRAYGSFPHPNVLAAFLLIALFFLYELWLKDKIHYSLLAGIFGLLFFALFLTFSRTIISVFLSASLMYFIFFFKNFRKKVLFLFLLITLYSLLFAALAWPEISSRFSVSLTDQAVGLRGFYNETAILLIKNYPFLGIGLGNFVWQIQQIFPLWESWLFQPVHNIYLLIASEAGLIGLSLFLLFIVGLMMLFIRLVRQDNSGAKWSLLFVFFSFFFIALFDHFFWTLQQGQLMFWVLLGMIASFDKNPAPNFGGLLTKFYNKKTSIQ